jgi:hypothetical protein
MSNTLEDLRSHLFDTLRGLKNKEEPLEIERAKAISDVAQTIINSARAEIDYVKVTGTKINSQFIQTTDAIVEVKPSNPAITISSNANGQRVVRHTLK